jgi:hypothetical protein
VRALTLKQARVIWRAGLAERIAEAVASMGLPAFRAQALRDEMLRQAEALLGDRWEAGVRARLGALE